MAVVDVFANPLFIPLLAASLTVVGNAVFLFMVRKWEYRSQYIISNVKETYIPLLSEIHTKKETFENFLERPDMLRTDFVELERIRKSGLFEFMMAHDKRLYEKIALFSNQICPRFRELSKLNAETRRHIYEDWKTYITQFSIDAHDAGVIANWILDHGVYRDLLNERKLNLSEKLFEAKFDMFENGLHPKGPFGYPNQCDELLRLSAPHIQKLRLYYIDTAKLIEIEVTNGLIPLMQKYIRHPI
ncbi:MAG: hypothetical protein ACBZ72_08900 [Candidatus Bathyarchaeia archaeon]|jgi:hypothetical protein